MPRRLPRVLMLAAAAAMLVTTTLATAQDVKIDIGFGVPPIVLAAPPQLVVVPGTSVYYAPDVPVNYFFYKGRYYTLANGVWSWPRSTMGHGP